MLLIYNSSYLDHVVRILDTEYQPVPSDVLRLADKNKLVAMLTDMAKSKSDKDEKVEKLEKEDEHLLSNEMPSTESEIQFRYKKAKFK